MQWLAVTWSKGVWTSLQKWSTFKQLRRAQAQNGLSLSADFKGAATVDGRQESGRVYDSKEIAPRSQINYNTTQFNKSVT